ncbi:hypothetical protein AAV96_17170 [Acinetobacter sp. AG1]|uniref:hypothetical protein n=1 Tax=Acinetobacter sp. AG1 TaxID=348388 RepID=UPI00062957A3|nr:hypothetical protein [Acinetobacter sp. AG1]KKW75101.1 hypothetical protein AAV96_17170 [Acinetobacter sp. AG1]
MDKLWVGSSDEFFQGLFAYLKNKFQIKMAALSVMQKNTAVCIYHETIVALESIHEVLRKIENGSAPTREDYENAIKNQDETESLAISDFYKKLALVDQGEFDAFQNFRNHYYFDTTISNYSVFLNEYSKNMGCEYGEYFELSSLWTKKNFDADKLFKFIESYQAQTSLGLITAEDIPDEIASQNRIYEMLIQDYDDLVSRIRNIGVSVVDIFLPSNLRRYEGDSELFSSRELMIVIHRLEQALRQEDGILLIVNHAHVINNNNFVLSYLLIYKANIFKTSEAVHEMISHEVQRIIGQMHMWRINVIPRDSMLQRIFPEESFSGKLKSKTDKQTFRNKFLRYFLSCIFLMKLDKGEELEHYEEMKYITLNNYLYFKEKIYFDNAEQENSFEVPKEKPKQTQPKVVPHFLDELINEIELEKFDKYFNSRGLPTKEDHKIQLIHFLCKQQDTTNVSEELIDDLIRIESFLSRLSCDPVYDFADGYNIKSFQASPKLVKLSFMFQQFLLVSEVERINRSVRLPRELNLKAISFLEQYDSFFASEYEVYKTSRLRRDLGKYRISALQPLAKQEQQRLNTASKKIVSIQNYLNQVLETDVVVLRFIFSCRGRAGEQATMFDDIFRDYVDNLKRRYTNGFRLEGHIGIYIPHRYKHYIDATLFFKTDKNTDIGDIAILRKVVSDYWIDYVVNKQEQIHRFNDRHPQNNKNLSFLKTSWSLDFSKSGLKTKKWKALNFCKNILNPFSDLKQTKLTARSLPIVKTENSLNHDYVEVFQGQRAKRKLLIEKVSLYYAYGPTILVRPDEYELLPRKNCLILGRIRSLHSK